MHLPRRALAASALALASLTAATGCTYTNAQQTAASYAPGAAAAVSLGTVHVAGLFVATGGEGPASLVARIVNSGDDAVSVRIAGTGDSSSLSGTFQVQPASTFDVGPAGEQTVTTSSFATPPGQVVTMEVSTGDDSQQLAVPVLDGTLEQYEQYVPTAAPTSTPTPLVTSSASPTNSRSASASASRTPSRAPSSSPDAECTQSGGPGGATPPTAPDEAASGTPSDG